MFSQGWQRVSRSPGRMLTGTIGPVSHERAGGESLQQRRRLRHVARCPGGMSSRTGLPRVSQMAWSFVVSPPRLRSSASRPAARSGVAPFFVPQRRAGALGPTWNRGATIEVEVLEVLEEPRPDVTYGLPVELAPDRSGTGHRVGNPKQVRRCDSGHASPIPFCRSSLRENEMPIRHHL